MPILECDEQEMQQMMRRLFSLAPFVAKKKQLKNQKHGESPVSQLTPRRDVGRIVVCV